MITVWNEIGGQWANIMLRLLWQGSITIAVIWSICRLWPSLPAAKRHWLWRLVYLKLFVLVVWQTPIDLPLLASGEKPISGSPLHEWSQPLFEKSQALEPKSPTLLTTPAVHGSVAAGAHTSYSPPQRITSTPTNVRPTVGSFLLLVWILGALACLFRAIKAYRATQRLRQQSETLAGTASHDLFVQLCQTMRLRRAPRLLAHPGIPSPLVVGCLKPCIIIPQPDDPNTVSAEMKLVLLHELAHVNRRDLWWGWLRVLVESLTFFHPFVRIARRHWNLSQEMACDEAVLTRGQVTAPSYQHALLKTLERGQKQNRFTHNLLAVGASGSFRDMKERLIAIHRMKTRSPFYQLAVATLIALVGLTGVLPYQLVAKEPVADELGSDTAEFFGFSKNSHDKDDAFHANESEAHAHADALFEAPNHGHDQFNAEIETDTDENCEEQNKKAKEKTKTKGQWQHDESVLSPVIQGLATALKSKQPQVRERVVEALSELEDPATIPVLIGALQDPDEDVRHEALHGLERFDDQRAIDAVSELLHSSSWRVRNQALGTLENFHHPKAAESLIKALSDPHYQNRLKALDALDHHQHHPGVLKAIQDSLHDDNWKIRKEAADLLGDLGSPKALDSLLHALHDSHPAVRDKAADALEELDEDVLHKHLKHLAELEPDQFSEKLAAHELKRAQEAEKQAERDHRQRMRDAENRAKDARRRAAREWSRNHSPEHEPHAHGPKATEEREIVVDEGIVVNQRQVIDQLMTELQSQREDRNQNQEETIQSIVDSVLSQVNERVEQAIENAMRELRRENRDREKSGADPFGDKEADDRLF